MDPLHCTACIRCDKETDYFMTECQHVMCKTCLVKDGQPKCQTCKKATKFMKIEHNPKFGMNFQLFTSDSYAEYLTGQITKIHKFQQNIMTCVTTEMKSRLEKYQNAYRTLQRQQTAERTALAAAKSELAAWHRDRKKLLDENKQLREQNQKLQRDVTVLKNKLTDERHSSGGPARKRLSGQRGGPYAPEWPDLPAAPDQRLTIAALDQPTPQSRMSTVTYVPPFPVKQLQNTTPLTLSHMRNSAGGSFRFST